MPLDTAADTSQCWPSPSGLTDSRYVSLAFAPRTEAAKALIAAATASVLAVENRTRATGPTRLASLTQQVGAILADVVRARWKGRAVSAQRRPGGGGWENSVFGCEAFWGRVDALERAGLVGVTRGVQTTTAAAAFAGRFGGLPSRVWATDRLMDLAREFGLNETDPKADWALSEAFLSKRIEVPADAALLVQTWDKQAGPCELPANQSLEAERFREWIVDLNEACAAADIGGCLRPAFRRSFFGDLRLGGRLHALGPYNFQTMAEDDRIRGITINGEPIAEADLSAAQLTIFLALTGTRELPEGDLYALPGISRAAAKAWFVQSFGAGKPAKQWGEKAGPDVRQTKPSAVRKAALARYPALADLGAVLPPDLRARLPEDRLGWAVGQYLVNWESRVVQAAIRFLMAQRGMLALPMHDALIIERSAAKVAERALSDACFALLKVRPKIKVGSAK